MGTRIQKENEKTTPRAIGFFAFFAIGIVIICVFAFGGVFIVSPGQRALLYSSNGGLENNTYSEGWHTKWPVFEQAIIMNVRVQKQSEQATAASSDLQDVTTTVAVNFQINQTDLPTVYRTIGQSTGNQDYMQTEIINPIVQESVKSVTARYTAEELIENRSEVKADIDNELTTRLSKYGIEVLDVSITDFQFSQTFTQAIEAKVTAQQKALEEQNNLAVVQYQAQQQVESAKGQAESIDIINKQLSQSPQYVQYMLVSKWDGHMPQALGSGSLLSIASDKTVVN